MERIESEIEKEFARLQAAELRGERPCERDGRLASLWEDLFILDREEKSESETTLTNADTDKRYTTRAKDVVEDKSRSCRTDFVPRPMSRTCRRRVEDASRTCRQLRENRRRRALDERSTSTSTRVALDRKNCKILTLSRPPRVTSRACRGRRDRAEEKSRRCRETVESCLPPVEELSTFSRRRGEAVEVAADRFSCRGSCRGAVEALRRSCRGAAERSGESNSRRRLDSCPAAGRHRREGIWARKRKGREGKGT